MLKFPPQDGIEIYPSKSGLICLEQNSHEFGKKVQVFLTIGQLRSLVKHSNSLIVKAEEAKKEWENETNS